jgi:hypothetical protein
MVFQESRCEKSRGHAAVAAPTPYGQALLSASPGNMALMSALAQTATSVVSTGTGPLPPDAGKVQLDTSSAFSTNIRRNPIAHAAGTTCTNPNLSSTDRIFTHGEHILSITKTLIGWCYNGQVVISTNSWGHAVWVNPSYGFCLAGEGVLHGPDGSWIGSYSTWAHGGISGRIGAPAGGACAAISSTLYNAVLRVAGNGQWDGYDDYPACPKGVPGC